MQLLRGDLLSVSNAPAVVAIGKFDGLHLGHRTVIDRAAGLARDQGLPLTLMSFEPLPHEFFAPATATTRLSRFVTKWHMLEALGTIETFACLRFNRRTAAQEADDFVRRTLAGGLGARTVVVGEDFRFGKARKGDVTLLEQIGREAGFDVEPVGAVCDDRGERISSSRVRQALEDNRLDAAAKLLGRPFETWGRVVTGERLGRRLGFPTANLALGKRPPPLGGIYVVRASGLPEGTRYGVANVGTRPSIGGTRRLLEVYFPEYSGNLYGRLLKVEFLAWLRDEAHFADMEALTQAMGDDVNTAAQWLRGQGMSWESDR
jgi:riboflavin kinase/FMN adenylyltransferase